VKVRTSANIRTNMDDARSAKLQNLWCQECIRKPIFVLGLAMISAPKLKYMGSLARLTDVRFSWATFSKVYIMSDKSNQCLNCCSHHFELHYNPAAPIIIEQSFQEPTMERSSPRTTNRASEMMQNQCTWDHRSPWSSLHSLPEIHFHMW
jgi:hypothetical protein